jgi:hypothetical protein
VDGVIALHDLWMPSIQAVVRFIKANRDYQIQRDFSGALPSLSVPQRSAELISLFLEKVAGTRSVLSSSVLDPWFTFRLNNMVFLEKKQDDNRNWRFHRQF